MATFRLTAPKFAPARVDEDGYVTEASDPRVPRLPFFLRHPMQGSDPWGDTPAAVRAGALWSDSARWQGLDARGCERHTFDVVVARARDYVEVPVEQQGEDGERWAQRTTVFLRLMCTTCGLVGSIEGPVKVDAVEGYLTPSLQVGDLSVEPSCVGARPGSWKVFDRSGASVGVVSEVFRPRGGKGRSYEARVNGQHGGRSVSVAGAVRSALRAAGSDAS